ncbi:MAG: hypothetical protein ABW130_19330 [Candidatus Thiodiazotropha lotti]
MKIFTKILMSLIAIAVAAAHMFLPSVTIDAITLTLLVLAAFPWLLPYIKDFEIPGVVKISLPETKAATDKLKKDYIIKAKPAEFKLTTHPATITATPEAPTEQQALESTFQSLRRISETEPNLALVGFRIEIERRIVRLAQIFDLNTDRIGLSRLVRELVKREIISNDAGSGLTELIALGNQAAHGADVTREAADWVLDVGPSILTQLEDVEQPEKNGSNSDPDDA